MSFAKKLYYSACSFAPLRLLNRLSGINLLLPYHHLVSDIELAHVKHLYTYKSVKQFKTDLDYLLRNYKPISVEEIHDNILTRGSLPPNTFLLTFDDGFREVHDVIAPILEAKGVPAVFFINPAFIDNKELFYRCQISLLIEEVTKKKQNQNLLNQCRKILQIKNTFSTDEIVSALKKVNNTNKERLLSLAKVLDFSFEDYLKQKQPFLTTDQANKLKKDGFTIGAHSWDHPYYHLLSFENQKLQTISSLSFVNEHFGSSPSLFSFPHSDIDITQSFFDEMLRENKVDLFFGIQNQKLELQNMMLHRFNAERSDLPIERQIKGILFLHMLRSLFKKNMIKRSV